MIEYCNTKLSKAKEAIIELKRKEDKSEADKLFDKLGFNKYESYTYIDYLSRETSKGITFRKNIQVIDSYFGISSKYITMQELQAIYKKCQELGWIE